MLDWRLKAFRHWQTMKEPTWAHVHYKPIDYQDISYYSAPRAPANAPKSLDEVDPKLLATYEKLGIPLHERARLAGRCGGRGIRQRFGGDHLQGKARQGRASFSVPSRTRCAITRELIERYLGTRRADGR